VDFEIWKPFPFSLLSPFSFPAQLRSSPLSFSHARSARFRVQPTAAQQAGSPCAPPPAADVRGPHVSFYLSPPPRLRLGDEPESVRRSIRRPGPASQCLHRHLFRCAAPPHAAPHPHPLNPSSLAPPAPEP
jgi:hypothetical protein